MNSKNKKKKQGRKFNHYKITNKQIELIESEYYKRINSEMPKWQAEMYI